MNPEDSISDAIRELHRMLEEDLFWQPPRKRVGPVPDKIEFNEKDVAFLASIGVKP